MNWFTIQVCGDCGQQVKCFADGEYCDCEEEEE